MFYYPNKNKQLKFKETLKTLYIGVGGEYYSGSDAWQYIKMVTNIDLYAILAKSIDNVD